ncbi:MAG: hypothetical protein WAN05_32510 [Roseiarcus sp.]
MNRILKKRAWLASASLLAIVLASTDANAVVFQTIGYSDYIIPSTGWYDFTVAGAAGGDDGAPDGGGDGAVVGGELFLAARTTLEVLVGGENGGQTFGGNGSGGGGGSFLWYDDLLFAAGGGGGAGFNGPPGGRESAPAAIRPVQRAMEAPVGVAFPPTTRSRAWILSRSRRKTGPFPVVVKGLGYALRLVFVAQSRRWAAMAAAIKAEEAAAALLVAQPARVGTRM